MAELSLIKLIRDRFPTRRHEILKGIGDDGLVFKNGIVVSTDSFVENVHFSFKYFSKFALGFHTMAASMSDLAAMGARPICALIALFLPAGRHTTREVSDLYKGFAELARKYCFDIAGGDIISSPYWGLTITVIGHTRKALLRSSARGGDGLFTTGFLGLGETGRLVLTHGLPIKKFPLSVHHHLYPQPRIKEALKLRKLINGCIDTSDGLSTDAYHLSEESGVKIIIDSAALPIHPEVKRFCSIKKTDVTEFILSAGEDFELLFTSPGSPRTGGLRLFKIGLVKHGSGVYLMENGKTRRVIPSGYEHLK